MQSKKSNNADLENKRSSIILLGLVCATSATLMSFEYANFELNSPKDLMSSAENEIIDWVEPNFEPIKPSTPVVEEIKESDEVIADDNPDVEEKEIVDVKNDDDSDNKKFTIPDVPDEFIIRKDTTTIVKIDPPVIPDKMPQFPGGIEEMYKFLSKEIDYPALCKDNGIQGKTYIQFTVEKDGSITSINVVKTPHSLIGAESSEVVGKMPNWEPGIKDNKPVRVVFTLPINFMLE